MVGTIIGALVGGTILGFLGKWLAPGDQSHVPLWLTILAGIGGAFLGTWAYTLFFEAENSGIDWWRHLWQAVAAAVLVAVAATVTGRKGAA